MNVHQKRKRDLEAGMKQLYSTIFDEYCMQGMQQRIETHPYFATQIDDNLIVLLLEIKKLIHEMVRAQYSLLTIHHAIKGLITMKQKDGEELLDFVKCFKQTRSTYRSYMGAAWFNHNVDTAEQYRLATTDEARRAIKEKKYEAYSALLILLSASPAEYSEVTKQLTMQFSIGTNQYPKTVTEAVDILVNHKAANKSLKPKIKKKSWKSSAKQSSNEKKTETSFAQRGKQTTQLHGHCVVCLPL